MRVVIGGLVACAALCAASAIAAGGGPPTAVDRSHDVRFTLDGRSLAVTVPPGPNTRAAYDGKRIDAICSSTLTPRAESRVTASQVWPAGANDRTFTFDRDISRKVKWCLLEHEAKDLAYALFVRLPGTVRVSLRVDERGGVPFEGAQHYFRVRDANRKVVVRLRATRFTRQLPPGRYAIATWHRICDGNCGQLGPRAGYAKRRFRVRTGRTTRLRVLVNYSRGSKISVVR
jgi:hypothetical protein